MKYESMSMTAIFSFLCLAIALGSGCQGLFEDLDELDPPDDANQSGEPVQIETNPVENIGSTEATFHGAIYEFPSHIEYDHGFCWATERRPILGEDDCHSLGTVDQVGSFSHDVVGLTPGRDYHVRAYAAGEGDEYYGDDRQFTTNSGTPEIISLEATQEGVELVWTSMSGVDDFVISRNDEPLTTVDGDTTRYLDESLARDSVPQVQDVHVVEANHETITIGWTPIEADDPVTYEYAVEARYPGETTVASQPEQLDVQTDVEVIAYEVEIDESGDWNPTDQTERFVDETAPPPSIDGALEASQGDYFHKVELALIDFEEIPGAMRTYRIRAVAVDDSRGDPSAPVAEQRQFGEFQTPIHWEYRDPDEGWQVLATTTAPSFSDETASITGEARDYRVHIPLSETLGGDFVDVTIGIASGYLNPVTVFAAGPDFTASIDPQEKLDAGIDVDNRELRTIVTDPEGNLYVAGFVLDNDRNRVDWFAQGYPAGETEPSLFDYVAELENAVNIFRPQIAVTSEGEVWVAGDHYSEDNTRIIQVLKLSDDSVLQEYHTFEGAELAGLVAAQSEIYLLWRDVLTTGATNARLTIFGDDGDPDHLRLLDNDGNEIPYVDSIVVDHLDWFAVTEFSITPKIWLFDTSDIDGSNLSAKGAFPMDANVNTMALSRTHLYGGLTEQDTIFVQNLSDGDDYAEISPGNDSEAVAISVDPLGFVYVGSSDGRVTKYDSDLDEIWTVDVMTIPDTPTRLNDIAVTPGPLGAFPSLW